METEMDRDELERLYEAREEASKAVSDLLEQVVVTWWGPGPAPAMPKRPVDSAFLDEYHAAKAKRDAAEAALVAYVQRPLPPRS